jgi:dienelactone hydrolase
MSRVRRTPVALLLAAVIAGCGGSQPVTLRVTAPSQLADAPAEVTVRGLDGPATLHASWRAFGGHEWAASVPLHASSSGTATLRGVDGMKFLWSMRPAGAAFKNPDFLPPADGPSDAALSVTVGGKTVARAKLSRRVTPASVKLRDLTKRKDGVVGVLFTPTTRTRRPAVVVFGGSEGGNFMIDAAGLLAAHGYPTLSLAYFGEPGLPKELVNVPLEYFARAVRVLRRQPGVDPDHIVVMGDSRGGEAALLVASTFPHLIHGAIGLVPSATVYPAPAAELDAWTLHGKPVARGQIPVERITGPVLTAGAGDDDVWASRASVESIDHRLTAHHFRYEHHGLVYEQAGHLVGTAMPYLPTPASLLGFGGTARADAAAKADLWRHILAFLAGEDQRLRG